MTRRPARRRRDLQSLSAVRFSARVTKVPARRAPEIGEHNEEVLRELGFDAKQIEGLRTGGAIPSTK